MGHEKNSYPTTLSSHPKLQSWNYSSGTIFVRTHPHIKKMFRWNCKENVTWLYTGQISWRENWTTHSVSIPEAEINSIQELCTDVSVNIFNQLSKLHLQCESFSTCSGAMPLLCTKANLYEHIQKKLSLLHLALVSFPVVRLSRCQEVKSTWSKLLTSLFLHTYSHKSSADLAGEYLHFRNQPKMC